MYREPKNEKIFFSVEKTTQKCLQIKRKCVFLSLNVKNTFRNRIMKLRTILKIISFLLLIFSTMVILRYPVAWLASDDVFKYEITVTLYQIICSTEVKIIELFLYLLFDLHMVMLDSKFPQAKFGKFFLADVTIAILNYIIITMHYDNVALGYIAKIALEITACMTTFLCGWSLLKVLKNHAMRNVGLSFILLSSNHLVYIIILGIQFGILMLGESNSVTQFLTTKWIVVQWILLMPLLFVSRIVLFRGTMMLKKHRKNKDEIA